MVHTQRKIDAVDVFCGVGGLTHGLERAGVNVIMGIDVDPTCRHAFQTNNKAKFVNADVRTMDAADISERFLCSDISLFAGCAPCQPFSTYSRSAKRMLPGEADSDAVVGEWGLLSSFGELIEGCQPDLVTMENVPPLGGQPVFHRFLGHLGEYHVRYSVIDSQMVGVPQTRKRLVLVASKFGPIEWPQPQISSPNVREVIHGLPTLAAGSVDPEDALHAAPRLSDLNLERIQASKPGGTWRDWPSRLRAKCHLRDSGATYPSVYGRMEWDAPSPTITTQCFGYGNGRFGHPEQDRAISLREAAMLQGFPREYSFLGPGECAVFSTHGRLIGNAVPVPLGEYIGHTLIEHVSRL